MSWTVDKPLSVGDLIMVPLVEMKVQVEAAGCAFVGSARKNPLLVLQFQQGTVAGIDVKGHNYDVEEIELLYPGAIAQAQTLINDMQ